MYSQLQLILLMDSIQKTVSLFALRFATKHCKSSPKIAKTLFNLVIDHIPYLLNKFSNKHNFPANKYN